MLIDAKLTGLRRPKSKWGIGKQPKSRMLINGIGRPAARGVTGEYVTRRENRKGVATRCPS